MRYCFFLIFFCLTSCQTNPIHSTESAIANTCRYLWNAQNKDGGWHSEVHGLLKKGNAYTPFVLWHLLAIPDVIFPKPKEKIAKAMKFIREKVASGSIMGKDETVLEYPNYASAYALMVLAKYGTADDKTLVSKLREYLLSQQFIETRQIYHHNPAYGSWGFGETRLAEGEAGHADISHTRRVLQALQMTDYQDATILDKAKSFLYICQKHPDEIRPQPSAPSDSLLKPEYDGGFYYSAVVTNANKGMKNEQGFYRSYATATCDGVLALLACGDSPESEAVQKGIRWLQLHPNLYIPEGIPSEHPEQWQRVMILYHLSARAETYWHFNISGKWQNEISEILQRKQEKNGSFYNPEGARNKENDPILGSTLALNALWHCIKKPSKNKIIQ
jgi:hypothetical protein